MYEAIVTRVHTRPHPKADKIQLGTCHSFQVVVGLDTKDDELGIYFPTDGQLSELMVIANNLYSKEARVKLGLPIVDTDKYGFFSDKRRVRAQSFRGEKSDGFWVPLEDIAWAYDGAIPPLDLVEGDTFTALNGNEICRKYETPATRRAQGNLQGKKRENKCFPKHDATKQFRYVSHDIPENAVLYITEKMHGTQGRFAYILDDVALPRWKKYINTLWPIFTTRQYKYLVGSKNVILNAE